MIWETITMPIMKQLEHSKTCIKWLAKKIQKQQRKQGEACVCRKGHGAIAGKGVVCLQEDGVVCWQEGPGCVCIKRRVYLKEGGGVFLHEGGGVFLHEGGRMKQAVGTI